MTEQELFNEYRKSNCKTFTDFLLNKIGELENDMKTAVSLLERSVEISESLTKAKEIILRLYNAGRDVLMCRAEEKAYDNLSNAINDKSIVQFLEETEQ